MAKGLQRKQCINNRAAATRNVEATPKYIKLRAKNKIITEMSYRKIAEMNVVLIILTFVDVSGSFRPVITKAST